jgi:hypothetical protein
MSAPIQDDVGQSTATSVRRDGLLSILETRLVARRHTARAARLLVAVGLLTGVVVAQDDPGKEKNAPQVLFHLSFDHGMTADESAGSAAPTNDGNLPELVDGIEGKAAHFGPNQYLRFSEKDNLNKQAGSFSVWVQWPVDGVGTAGPLDTIARSTIFAEDGPITAGSNVFWAWLRGGVGLRFDLHDVKKEVVSSSPPGRWLPGEWHNLVYTWDADAGRIQVYEDTRLAADKFVGSWIPKSADAFFLGADNAKGAYSWNAAIDEVTIYDRPLSREEVLRKYLEKAKLMVNVTLLDPFFTAGKTGPLRLELADDDLKAARMSDIKFEIKGADGSVVQQGAIPDQAVEGSSRHLVSQPLLLAEPGTYGLTLTYTDQGVARSYADSITVLPARVTPPTEPTKLNLVATVDATKSEPLAQQGGTNVVTSGAGEYREAGPNRHDRFAMDFTIKDVGAPHVAVITYPDDKPRTMEIILQDLSGHADYQAQSGVFTGDEYAVTGKMLETRVYFWPQSTRQALIFMTAEKNHPAAVKTIQVYRLDHFTPSATTGQFTGSVPSRRTGVYFEDCVLHQVFGTTSDRDGFMQATDRLLDYMQFCGETELCYPVIWYNGPLYGTLVEPTEPNLSGGGKGGDRPHPVGFPALLLKKLDARGMKFSAGAHIHWLPSLDPYTLTDQDRVNKGEETVVNVRDDGKLWYGYWHGHDPNYNPIDPRVLGAVRAVLNEVVERYGQEPAFTGITLVMAQNKLYTFGSIESGYNDCNLQSFQKESGVTIPAYAAGKPSRFADSYHWLMDHPDAKKAWIDWRCQKLHDQYKQIADAMTAQRPDLKLTLDIFPARYDYNRLSDYLDQPALEALRETGIDPRLYAHDANIDIGYTLVPADYRWKRSLNDTSETVRDNRTIMTAPEIAQSLGPLPQVDVTLHDRYWEDAIGKTAPLQGLSPDPNVQECRWRVSTLNASGFNAMEPYVAALNNFDALKIDKGGFLMGTMGMESELAAFSHAFDALPAVRFDDVAGVDDPVRVRQKVVDGKLYFYVLNRLPEPVEIKIALQENGPVDEPASGQSLGAANEITLQLAPYDLRVFRSDSSSQRVTGAQSTIDPAWIENLHAELDKVQKSADAKRDAAPSMAAFIPYLEYAQKCWQQKAYARLYFLLQESWCAELEQP